MSSLVALFDGVIDPARIIHDRVNDIYGPVTTGFVQPITAALKPVSIEEIQKIVAVARQNSIRLYPLSTGRNWGYSDSMPAGTGHVILDLSLMNRVHDYNSDMGIVTIEPGVTQQQLCDYLERHGAHHVISVTGSSPGASIVGNYLERGFGLLPIMDHAASVMSLQAVLGDGTLYNSPLQSFGATESANVFRWGSGPYTDGLFFQSSFGVATSMTIKLARKPECVRACLIEVDSRENLDEAIRGLYEIREVCGVDSLQIKILNGYYTLASMGVKHADVVSCGSIDQAYQRYSVPPYTIMVTFMGPRSITKALQAEIKSSLKKIGRMKIVSDKIVRIASLAKPFVSLSFRKKIVALEGMWSLLQGKPGAMMIGRIPYHKTPDDRHLKKVNPAQDKCGIIWFSQILPFRAQAISDFEELGDYAQKTYGFSPILNFTNYSHSCLIGLMAIVFDQSSESEPAHECYMDLLYRARDKGYFPYRMPIFASEEFLRENSGNEFNVKLKSILDPDGIFPRQC